MDRQRMIAFVILYACFLVLVVLSRLFFGNYPAFPYVVMVGVVVFCALATWILAWGIQQWKESRRALEESEESFLEAAEREAIIGPRVLSEKVMEAGGSAHAGGGAKGQAMGGGGSEGLGAATASAVPATGGSGALSSVGSAFSPETAGGSSSPAKDLGPAADVGTGGAPEGASASLEKLASDLRRLGVVTAYEGKVELPPPASPGLIYGLRQGGLALLLDEMESHRFLAFQARRFRAIIVRGPEGRPLVVQRYEDFVTGEMSSPRG